MSDRHGHRPDERGGRKDERPREAGAVFRHPALSDADFQDALSGEAGSNNAALEDPFFEHITDLPEEELERLMREDEELSERAKESGGPEKLNPCLPRFDAEDDHIFTPPQPPPPFVPKDPYSMVDDVLAVVVADPFPRTQDLSIQIAENGLAYANVPKQFVHYLPETLGGPDYLHYRAGPGTEGHPGRYELALAIMAHYLPAWFDGYHNDDVILRTRRPAADPVRLSRPAWDLHAVFAEQVLQRVGPEGVRVPAGDIYRWVLRRRPELEELLLAEPTPDPFDGLF